MRLLTSFTLPILLLTFLLPGCSREQGSTEVRQIFLDYRAALLANDGNAAADLVDTGTIAYYQRMLDHALDSDERTVRKLRFVDRFQVLFLRHLVPAEELRRSDGRAIFVQGVERGWIGDQVGQVDVGHVSVSGDTAWVSATQAGEPTGVSFRLVREAEGWRLDLLSVLHTAETGMTKLASKSGLTEDEFMLAVLEQLGERTPSPAIWQPVERK